MKKSTVWTVLLIVCLAALAAFAFSAFGGSLGLHYANAEQYTAGETALNAPIEALEIKWIDGSVNIAYHAENTVTVTETSKMNIPADLAVRWWLDGSTLRIQYAKDGAILLMKNLQKQLTVTLPEGLRLKTASISGTSADLNAPALRADEIKLSSTSGDIRFTAAAQKLTLAATSGNIRGAVADAEEISAASTSGSISLDQSGEAKTVRLASTSGAVQAKLESVGALSVSTTSGNIALDAQRAEEAGVTSTSGSVTLSLAAFGSAKVNTTSGSVTAALPGQPGFTGEFSTTSGSFESALSLRKDGKIYTCGDGSARIAIHTTSGNIRLK